MENNPFRVEEAVRYGWAEAVALQKIGQMIEQAAPGETVELEGRVWIGNVVDRLVEQMPYVARSETMAGKRAQIKRKNRTPLN